MRIDSTPGGPALLPAQDPKRETPGYRTDPQLIAFPGQGTGHDVGAGVMDSMDAAPGLWYARWRRWRDGFEQRIGPDARRYWSLYRAFDEAPLPGPNQEWRDRTVIPEAFKVIETRVPRLVLGLWGKPESTAVEGRGFRDEQYEEMIRVLLQATLDEIGRGGATSENFQKRMMDAERYKQIMGHVWYRVTWKHDLDWLRTKVPIILDEQGRVQEWEEIELLETIFDGVDIQWLPLDSLAVDLAGQGNNRRWAIERVWTSLEALKRENEKFKEETGEDLYKNLEMINWHQASPTVTRESYEEPRDTEHWPLTDDQITDDPGETKLELWLCWDNVYGTLTKYVNRSIQIAHGVAPTPDRRDPYVGAPAVPVPGRIYGDSILHWVGPLITYQTKIARARADEVLLNVWQQYLYREGSLRQSQWFWRPGGAMAVEQSNPDKPVDHDVKLLQRRPVFQEAFSEEGYRQQQTEATAGADALSQGIEATSKSRDVTATETSQRVLQGATRYQTEILYNEVTVKKPILQKVFDLLRANLTQPKMIRILDDQEDFLPIDLRQLDRPIDIVVGGGVREATQQEKINELREMIQLGNSPNYGPYLKHGEIVKELFKNTRTLSRSSHRFVRSEEEVKREQQAQAMAMAAAQGGGQSGSPPPLPAPGEGPPLPEAAGVGAGGDAGPSGLAGPAGQGGPRPGPQSEPSVVEI